MTRTLLHLLVFLGCVCVPAAAQDAATSRDLRGLGVSAGSRVRVVAPAVFPAAMKGRIEALTADSLLLGRGGGARLQIDTREVVELSVTAGRNRFGWALRGAGIGLLAGAVLGATAGGHGDDSGWGALVGFVAGGIVGLPLGAGVGAAAAPERWTLLRLPPVR
jgi:hypothetical protein